MVVSTSSRRPEKGSDMTAAVNPRCCDCFVLSVGSGGLAFSGCARRLWSACTGRLFSARAIIQRPAGMHAPSKRL